MLAEAIQKIVGLAPPERIEIDGVQYSDETFTRIKQTQAQASPIEVSSLDGLVAYIASTCEEGIVQVVHPGEVRFVSDLFGAEKQRDFWCKATIYQYGAFPCSQYLEQEEFITELLSKFVVDEQVEFVAAVIGGMTTAHVKEVSDDTVTQSIAVQDGVKFRREALPNPVYLRPYRTFPEVAQPKTAYVLRVRVEGDTPKAALFEIKTGLWQLEAAKSIADYLREKIGEDMTITW